MKKVIVWKKRDSQDSDYFSYGYNHHRKSKADWAGISMGDAFKYNLEYFARLPAQRLFYQTVRNLQKLVLQISGKDSSEPETKVKPQLGPLYTNYPTSLAAFASIGLTVFLEYLENNQEGILMAQMKQYIENPDLVKGFKNCDPESCTKITTIITKIVQNRLLLEDLKRHKRLSSIETYRIYSAAQQNLKFETVTEVLNTIILYGDLLPSWKDMQLHQATEFMMDKLDKCSQEYFSELEITKSNELLYLGELWVLDLCKAMAEFLPPKVEKDDDKDIPELSDYTTESRFIRYRKKFRPQGNDRISPLNKPKVPSLFDSPTPAEQMKEQMFPPDQNSGGTPSPQDKAIQDVINSFTQALDQAGGQDQNYEDMRSDLVEKDSRINPFDLGPVQGNPTQGQQVEVKIGDNSYKSEMYDRPIELSDNSYQVDKLINDALPLTKALKRTLYPNTVKLPVMENMLTSGSLDPTRLAQVEFASAVFKRYRMQDKQDKQGRPVLAIICDGSGSLNSDQIRMLKLLTTGWLQSTLKSSVQIIAGMYNTGSIRKGVTGPLIQWMYHPYKTPSIGQKDAVRALVSLPNSGTGGQYDAPSIAFIMQEAQKIARGRMIYTILITDTQWIKSFQSDKTAMEEVQGLFAQFNQDIGAKLHTTLVALGVNRKTGFENLMDKVVRISTEQLKNPMQVAEDIGVYVASCMKERTKILARSK